MSKNILVRVYNSSGGPVSGARVSIMLYQTLAGGMLPDNYTNSSGEAEFNADADSGAEAEIYVNGDKKVSRGSIRGDYRISI